MARIRTIKPDLWSDDKFLSLDFFQNLLLVGLIQFADDEGYITAKPTELNARIFCGRSDAKTVVEACRAIEETGIIRREVDASGSDFFCFPGWTRHQKIAHPTPSRIRERLAVQPPSTGTPRPTLLGPDNAPKGQETAETRRFRKSPNHVQVGRLLEYWKEAFARDLTPPQAQLILNICHEENADPRLVIATMAAQQPIKNPFAYLKKMFAPNNPNRFVVPDEVKRTCTWYNWVHMGDAKSVTLIGDPTALSALLKAVMPTC